MRNLNKKLELERSRGDKKLFKLFILILPLTLFFSYYPIIGLGADESMNFELSLPLIWLVLFDILVFIMMIREKILFRGLKGKWIWLLFPIYLTVSVLWSLNSLRGFLTVGILWLIYFAIYGMYQFRELFNEEFRQKFLKWFFGATLVVCLWCFVQCILDLAGVSREYSLMCAGCTYKMFGFPHPNGFAIEPQFMGNLLLAPAVVAAWLYIKKHKPKKLKLESSRGRVFYNKSGGLVRKFQFPHASAIVVKNTSGSDSLYFSFLGLCFFIISTTLFLTFSRGAIYAFIVAMVFMSAFMIMRERREKRKKTGRKVGIVWGVVVLAFLFTLNLQGIMSAMSPTTDTYFDGIAKAINHLSLGTINIRGENLPSGKMQAIESGKAEEIGAGEEALIVEKPVENFEEKEEAAFDGYVEESTNTRMRLTDSAVKVWSQNFQTALFGVGLGGAGQALYVNNLSPAPKEIIQNEYASLLLETGLVGISLFILTIALILKVVIKNKEAGLVLALMVAYGVSLMFFSGLPNALQIYLLVPLFIMFML